MGSSYLFTTLSHLQVISGFLSDKIEMYFTEETIVQMYILFWSVVGRLIFIYFKVRIRSMFFHIEQVFW